jgi:multisubunit Na+/H+ antiporter MnhB subunit
MKHIGRVLSAAIIVGIVALVVYSMLQWLSTPPGSFVDWAIGIGAVMWLIVIVTVPWNLHFEAKTVRQEARRSQERNIKVDTQELSYARKVERRSLWLAIGLHIISAVALYALSYFKVSVVGYFGAGATLLFTLLRPAMRAYEYISERLANLRHEVSYPREDVYTLRNDVDMLKEDLRYFNEQTTQQQTQQDTQLEQLSQLLATLEQTLKELTSENEQAHKRLSDETRHAVAQLNEDGKFIDNIVEIIRFIKKV